MSAAAGGPAGLRVHRLTVSFGPTRAVDEVSLVVAPGEVLALLGPSGCGKSTLLRTVAGLEPAPPGTVAWAGQDLATVPVHRRGFGLMFQDGQLFPHRDVAGNVAFGLHMARVPRTDRASRVEELLDLVGLTGAAGRPVATLSGGEQQRVALARSLAPRPRLLLLDEPLSALDRSLRDRLGTDLQQILRRTGTTALYVTHDHDEAFTVADRVAVMVAGRLLQTAAPHELWRHPADEVVARFLGYRWFVPAAGLAAGTPPGVTGDAVLGLRPESLVVDPAGPLEAVVVSRHLTRAGTSLEVHPCWLPAAGGDLAERLSGLRVWTPGAWPGAVRGSVRLRLEPAAVAILGGSDFGEQQQTH